MLKREGLRAFRGHVIARNLNCESLRVQQVPKDIQVEESRNKRAPSCGEKRGHISPSGIPNARTHAKEKDRNASC